MKSSLMFLWLCIGCVFHRSGNLGGEETKELKPPYFLSICAIFQNEGPYLKEWIEYHRLVGVDHFFLYNNNSDDDYRKVLDPYIAEGVIELIEWPGGEDGQDWYPWQMSAYKRCLRKSAPLTQWLAFIDIDEFIVPVQHPNLVAFLSQFDNTPSIGGIKINWQLYGTSRLPSLPSDRLLIESLTWKAPWNYDRNLPNNTVVKSIVRPSAVKEYRIHEGDYKEGFYAIPQEGSGRFQPVQIDQIRINHYWTRAEDFFQEVKIDRRLRMNMPANYVETMLQMKEDLNQVEDPIMLRFVPDLKKRMGFPD